MEFQTAAHQTTYEKLVPWVNKLFGTFAHAREDAPTFGLAVGSAYVQIGVMAWGEDDATITTRAYVVTGVELTPDLMHYLLRENDRMRFGAFGVDQDNDIFFEHTIVGSTCDMEELKSSVLAVVYTADQYDDQIIQKWGGQRAVDRRSS